VFSQRKHRNARGSWGVINMSKSIRRGLIVVLTALIGIAIAGCESTGARPAALTGDDSEPPAQHDRHATGIESQARDM